MNLNNVFELLILLYLSINKTNCFISSDWGKLINATKLYQEKHFSSNVQYFDAIFKTTNISKECESSILDTIKALKNSEDWSHQMYNSWGKFPPSGFLSGTFADFGDYDQCLAIRPNQVIKESQYCLIDISLPLPKPMPIHQNIFHRVDVLPEFVNKSGNNVFVGLSKDASFFYWFHIRLGICAPKMCSKREIEILTENR
jgi:hypothetical protein